MTSTVPRVPQTRTRRDKGTDNMIEATVRLLRERGPEQVTVRDVAEASGHHHRFVQAWFGGKVGLFRAAFDRMIHESAGEVSFGGTAPLAAKVRSTVVLMNWLVAAEPGSLDGPRPTPIIDQVTDIYRASFGLEPDVARLMALRMVGASIAAVLFAGPLGLTDEDVTAISQLEVEVATLLAASRSGAAAQAQGSSR